MLKFVTVTVALLILCGQLIRLPLFLFWYQKSAIIPNDVGLVAIAGLVLLQKLYKRRLFYRHALFGWPMAAFVAIAVVSLGVNTVYYNLHTYEVFISGLYLARWVLYACVYFVFLDLVRTRQDVVWATWVFGLLLLSFAAFGIYQAFTLPNFAYVVDPEGVWHWDVQGNRLVSTFLDPNLAGCLIAVGLVFALLSLMEGYRKALIPIAVFGAALILTYSRGAILSLGVGVLYLIFTGKHKWRALAGIVVAVFIFLMLIPYLWPHAQQLNRLTISDDSAMSRIVSWRLGLNLIRDNFFFGVGFDTLPYVVGKYGMLAGARGSAFGMDGGLLTIFALSGVFGLAAYCYLLGRILQISRWVYANSGDRVFRIIAKGTFASVLVIVTSSFFTSSLLYIFIMEFYWAMFALLNVAYVLSLRPATSPASKELSPAMRRGPHFGRPPVPVTTSTG